MKSPRFRFLVPLGICVAVAHSQTSERPSASARTIRVDQQSPPSQTTGMKPPQPADAIQTLTNALAGTWTTSEKYEPVGPTPHGGMGKGEAVWRPGPGGFTLLEEYHAQTPIGELFGFGIVWWDSTRELQHLWCINVNPTGCEMFPGPPLPGPKWDGKQLLIDTEVVLGGKKFSWREVIGDITPTSYAVTVDIGDSRAALTRWLTSRATKVTKGAPG
jgi:hypothetical protein